MALAIAEPRPIYESDYALRQEVEALRAELRQAREDYANLERRHQMLLAKRSLSETLMLASGAEIDPARCEVSRRGRTVRIGRGQWRVLEDLATAGRLTSVELARAHYGSQTEHDLSAMRMMVSRLRKTLARVGASSDLVTTPSGWMLARPAPARSAVRP